MISKQFFSERLRALRKTGGETQKQVGEAIGIGERHYQKFEGGDNFPSTENLCALADHYKVSIDYLLGRTDNPEVNH
ncbi:MAG: helix-turn-helix domain-containing protein [Oscillospiraceae bacterium]|nr:helix-turn-helix domain-containing protein [Oscillospiraceae bacterium]